MERKPYANMRTARVAKRSATSERTNKASGAGRQASARKYADARGLTPDASVVYQRQPTVTGTYSHLTWLPLIHWYFVSTYNSVPRINGHAIPMPPFAMS